MNIVLNKIRRKAELDIDKIDTSKISEVKASCEGLYKDYIIDSVSSLLREKYLSDGSYAYKWAENIASSDELNDTNSETFENEAFSLVSKVYNGINDSVGLTLTNFFDSDADEILEKVPSSKKMSVIDDYMSDVVDEYEMDSDEVIRPGTSEYKELMIYATGMEDKFSDNNVSEADIADEFGREYINRYLNYESSDLDDKIKKLVNSTVKECCRDIAENLRRNYKGEAFDIIEDALKEADENLLS